VLNATALAESGGDPVVTKYYFHALSKTGASRVAMDREGVIQYLATDHLGSTSLVMDDLGSAVAESRHYPTARNGGAAVRYQLTIDSQASGKTPG
jgi:hypothetical protein